MTKINRKKLNAQEKLALDILERKAEEADKLDARYRFAAEDLVRLQAEVDSSIMLSRKECEHLWHEFSHHCISRDHYNELKPVFDKIIRFVNVGNK